MLNQQKQYSKLSLETMYLLVDQFRSYNQFYFKNHFSKPMKKLLDIIKLDQTDACYQLELDFKTERHNLKRYLKSMKELKSRLKTDHQYFANLLAGSTEILNEHTIIKKKNSQLDYFIISGVKPFKAFNFQAKKLQNFYSNCYNQVKDLVDRVVRYLDQSKDSFNRVSKQHQKVLKQYAQKCFPETSTVLYILGFVNGEKIKKIQDMMKQQGLLKETQMYINVLNTYLDQMEGLKTEATKLFKEYYMAATRLWIDCCQSMHKQMSLYNINQAELQLYYQQTGGAMTDRSDRSNRQKGENNFGQQQI